MSATASMLKGAVHHNHVFKAEGISERLFTHWFKGFFYNQIWEDARVDMEALQINQDSRMLTISSAGCNVMNYLSQSPAQIMAVDLNQNHIYLTRLKLAAVSNLPTYEEFFKFFGYANSADNITSYYNYIRQHLDETTRYFWEGGAWLRTQVLGPRIEYFTKGLYNHARLGYFLRFLHAFNRITGRDSRALLTAKTPEEQEQLFNRLVAPLFDNKLVRAVANLPFFLFGIGVPPSQINHIKRETNGDVLVMYRERVRKLCCEYPVDDNYFLWQAAGRCYDSENRKALPEYLKQENFDTIKANACRVTTEVCTVIDRLQRLPDNSLDRFVFLDSQDWMKPDQLDAQWREIARVGKPGTRIIFRTASSMSIIEDGVSADTRKHFQYEEQLSKDLHKKDRSAIYGGFHVYSMPHN